MRKKYDDFTQLKLKDMSKSISDMTYKYINPDTQEPTKVPAIHYEKILDQVTEKYMSDITTRQFLNIMYNQLVTLRKEDEKYFNQALLCIDLGINPKDLRVNEQVALNCVYNYFDDKQRIEGKKFHFMAKDIVDNYDVALSSPQIQSQAIKYSNEYEQKVNELIFGNKNKGRDRDSR